MDSGFDAALWIKEHGAPPKGCKLILQLDSSSLAASLRIADCACWKIPELHVGQECIDDQGRNHRGFSGAVIEFLEKTRNEIDSQRSIYGDKLDDVLARIEKVLHAEPGDTSVSFSLIIWDPSGLSEISADLSGCVVERTEFVRSAAHNVSLCIAEDIDAFPVQHHQLSTVEEVADLLSKCIRIVALTGAGISVESGITPFRNPSANDKGSVWGTFDAGKMTNQNFNTDVQVTAGWWKMKRSLHREIRSALPNPAHQFFATLEELGKLGAVVTQNIDSLHLKAGVSAGKVIELHGHCRGLICSDNKTPLNPLPFKTGNCTYLIPADEIESVNAIYEADSDDIPRCPWCNCPLRSEVVMFGQQLCQHDVDAATDAIDKADVLLVIGSTLLVYPANDLPALALQKGIPVVMINFDATKYDVFCTGLVRQKAGEFLADVSCCLSKLPQAKPVEEISMTSQQDAATASALKEGNRWGRQIDANTRETGQSFFCLAVESADGDFSLLETCLSAMNESCPNIGKMIFSASLSHLAVLAYIPKKLRGADSKGISCFDWLQSVSFVIGGKLLEHSATEAVETRRMVVESASGVFPFKLKEVGITAAIAFLKAHNLFPDDDEDDEWQMKTFDDFPEV